MVDEIAAGLERFPEHPGVLYRLACAETLAGRTDDALGHIARAVALRPDLATYANEEPDLAPLRGLPGFPTP
jgi:hypothetical protein